MNLNHDVVYRCLRLGPLHQLHPGRSRSLVRHHDRLHRPPPCVWYVVIFRIPSQTSENRTAKLDAPMNSSASQTRGSGRCDGTGRQSRSVDATVHLAKILTAMGMAICHPDDSPDRSLSTPTRAAAEGRRRIEP